MSVASVEIPLTEPFTDPNGRLVNYDAYDGNQRVQLSKQQHRDIRCFVQSSAKVPLSMRSLDVMLMSDTDGVSMDDTGTITFYDEGWIGASTQGPVTAAKNWWGITITGTSGQTATATSVSAPIDLSDLDASAYHLSLALPSFPADKLSLANCSVAFTSEPAGNFATGPTVSLPMASLTTAGHRELSVPLTALAPIGYVIVGVRFTLKFTAAATVTCVAIRALSDEWVYAPVDVNTLTHKLVHPPSRNGDPAAAIGFPANTFADPQVPTDWPILFRATTPSTSEDPRPIDLSYAVTFLPQMGSGGEIRLYFREYAYDLVTQLDLDLWNGSSGITQAQLEAMGRQPDFDKALYRSKTQTDIEGIWQDDLDGVAQFDLEAKPDYFTASWIEAVLSWTDAGSAPPEPLMTQSTLATSPGLLTQGESPPPVGAPAALTISDTEGNSYAFNMPWAFVGGARYILVATLEENAMRVRIYQADALGDPDLVALDTGLIRDDFTFPRRSGRVGFYARLDGGNAWIEPIRTYNANFAEYRSVPLHSITPVVGGQVFYGGSPPRELYRGLDAVNAAVVTPDSTKSSSGVAYRVDTTGRPGDQGMQTNAIEMEALRDTTISFDLWVPSGTAPLAAFITDIYGTSYPLNIGLVQVDRWTRHRLDLGALADTILPGSYRFNLTIAAPGVRHAFYVDNLSVSEQVLVWSGRSDIGDPWNDSPSDWMPFRSALNAYTAGALFPTPGSRAQIRALARKQNTELTDVRFIPKYAELGRLVWDDQRQEVPAPIVTGFTATSTLSNTLAFSVASTGVTLATDAFVAYYEWDFGDGARAAGPSASHTYDAAGPYRAALTVVDNFGGRATTFQNVVVP